MQYVKSSVLELKSLQLNFPSFVPSFLPSTDPPGVRLKFHQIVSNVVVIFEYSSYFYLLAFINRKFKREFLKQVVYGKFLRSKYFGTTFNNMSMSSHGGSTQKVRVRMSSCKLQQTPPVMLTYSIKIPLSPSLSHINYISQG